MMLCSVRVSSNWGVRPCAKGLAVDGFHAERQPPEDRSTEEHGHLHLRASTRRPKAMMIELPFLNNSSSFPFFPLVLDGKSNQGRKITNSVAVKGRDEFRWH